MLVRARREVRQAVIRDSEDMIDFRGIGPEGRRDAGEGQAGSAPGCHQRV
jgi:hypothetical protein